MSAATAESVGQALEEHREVLQVDGADLELTGVQDDVVEVRLVFGPETCQECILSREMLETVLLSGLEEQGISRVVIDDPRESA